MCSPVLKILHKGRPKIKANQIKANQIKANQIKANQIKANQIKANQTKANQTKANQTKANQTKANQTKAKGVGTIGAIGTTTGATGTTRIHGTMPANPNLKISRMTQINRKFHKRPKHQAITSPDAQVFGMPFIRSFVVILTWSDMGF
jgi:uncharacterized protein YjbI with pentapeptide repeats